MRDSATSGPGWSQIARAVSQAGALAAWRWPLLFSLALLTAWEMWSLGVSDSGVFLCCLLSPFFAGTGVLGAAREGRFDLLSGRGVSRRRLLAGALLAAFLPPAAVFGASVCLSERGAAALAPAFGGFVFAFGLSFLVGLWGPAALPGIVWTLVQVAYFLSAPGRDVLMLLREAQAGGPPIPTGRLALALAALPEFAAERGVDPGLPLLHGAVGIACVVVAFAWFERADWPGKRMS